MQFEKSYRRSRAKEDSQDPKVTILPFFNFSYDSDCSSSTDTDWSSGFDKPRWRRMLQNAARRNYESFTRSEPSPNAELEEAFVKLFRARYRTVWETPYICLSASEFHRMNSVTKLGSFFTYLGFACAIPALISLLSRTPGPFWLSVLAALILIIIGGTIDSKHQNKRLSDMGEEYIEKNKKAYLNSMVKAYGKEMGQILQKIAIQEGRDVK